MLAKISIEGNIVKDYYIENTHILISDVAYISHSPEENQRILEQATQASINIIIHNQQQDVSEENVGQAGRITSPLQMIGEVVNWTASKNVECKYVVSYAQEAEK